MTCFKRISLKTLLFLENLELRVLAKMFDMFFDWTFSVKSLRSQLPWFLLLFENFLILSCERAMKNEFSSLWLRKQDLKPFSYNCQKKKIKKCFCFDLKALLLCLTRKIPGKSRVKLSNFRLLWRQARENCVAMKKGENRRKEKERSAVKNR